MNIRFFSVVFGVLLLDQLTKAWARTLTTPISTPLVEFIHVTNTGASFSILQGQNLLLIGVSVLALGFLYRYRDEVPSIVLALLAAGILGNLIDRIFLGAVTDFINLRWWPVFNVADSSLVIGVISAIVLDLRQRAHPQANQKKRRAAGSSSTTPSQQKTRGRSRKKTVRAQQQKRP